MTHPWGTKYRDFKQEMSDFIGHQGIAPDHVTLVAVSKFASVQAIRDLHDLGQIHFAERRWQEAEPKIRALRDTCIIWNFIGKIQSNKLKFLLPHFSVFHSIDTIAIAFNMDKQLQALNKQVTGYLQINLANEPQKSGFDPQELLTQYPRLFELKHIHIKGLMAIPPKTSDATEAMTYFNQLKNLRDTLINIHHSPHLTQLSMGMSGDWKEALLCGATTLRIGSHLF